MLEPELLSVTTTKIADLASSCQLIRLVWASNPFHRTNQVLITYAQHISRH